MSDRMPEDMPDKVPECLPDRMPEDLPDNMPEDMPEHMPEDMPGRMPEDMPGRMPEDMPDRMPDRMPEDMPDRMLEALPRSKCINVMVGITGSKVISFYMFLQQKRFVAGATRRSLPVLANWIGGLRLIKTTEQPTEEPWFCSFVLIFSFLMCVYP